MGGLAPVERGRGTKGATPYRAVKLCVALRPLMPRRNRHYVGNARGAGRGGRESVLNLWKRRDESQTIAKPRCSGPHTRPIRPTD